MTPREKIRSPDLEALTDGQLLQLLTGPRTDSNDLLAVHGSLHALIRALPKTRSNRTTDRLAAALEVARRHYAADVLAGESLNSPGETSRFLVSRLRDRPFEVFCCLYLDARHRLIAFEELFRGTIDGASVHPREVVRQALAHNAASLIFAHNHPSGVAEPSRADELITLRLRDALALVDIRVLDHLIVAGPRVVSLAEKGLI
ncbi:MAG: DNA repair protein RadC [Acidibacter sp.]|jgi:DNA repair protein RadC|nr:DNA repair protein RadC [Acidibacter sp.]